MKTELLKLVLKLTVAIRDEKFYDAIEINEKLSIILDTYRKAC